jgi:tetratricopeptide (TPR) repeat protein
MSHDPVPDAEPLSRRDRLFDEALALPPGERTAFLDRSCSDDPELRAELASLLAAHEASAGFFEGLSRDWVSPFHSAGVGGGGSASVHLPPGSRVARYEITGLLGEGGMGVVYRARDPDLERDVALKLLPPHAVEHPGARAGLLAEARKVARLDHPHIGVIHEVGETEDAGVYLAMACHEGETLADRLRRGPLPLPPSDVLQVGRAVAAALEAAHGAGIVHRDVKPSNVLLTRGGGVRLVDFGIAAAVGERAAPRGSRGYASPELLTGQVADVRTDLWSLGVLLHEMATGVRPPPPPEGLPALDAVAARGSLPEGLEGAIRACLTPELADRPAGASAVAALLGTPAQVTASGSGTPAEALASPEGSPRDGASASRPGAPRSAAPDGRAPRPLAPRGWAAAGVLGAGVILAALFVLLPRPGGTGGEAPGPVGAILWGDADRVLVLPFEDRTEDPALASLGIMAADWIAEGVARTGVANVVDPAGALAAHRDTQDPLALAGLFRAGLVVAGNVQVGGDSVRIQARLVDGENGTILRSLATVTAPLEAPDLALEPLRQAALSAVALHLDPLTNRHELLVVEQPPPWEAFLAFVRGKEDFVEARWREAREAWIRAEALDPTFHLAVFYGAIAAANLGDFDDLEARRDRMAAAIPPGHRPASLGLDFLNSILAGDHEASYRNHRRGVDEGILAPGTLGHAQLVQDAVTLGRFREAVEVARTVDPTRGEVRGWYAYWGSFAMAHHGLGEFEEELQVARRARELMGPLRIAPLYPEVRALAAMGRLEEIAGVAEDARRISSAPSVFLRGAGDYLVMYGHEAEGLRYYREAVAQARADLTREPLVDRDFHLAEALLALAAALGSEGRDEALEARALHLESHERNPHFIDPPFGLARAAVILGDTAEARRWSDHLAGTEPRGRYGGHTWRRARIAALLGEPQEVARLLEQAYREGLRVQFAAREDPLVMRHRDHPAVAGLLRAR